MRLTEESHLAMEPQMEKQMLSNGQLILVPHKETLRLLEVYVKRSLSVNDGTLVHKRDESKAKWVTIRQRRHSSDPSLHFEGLTDGELGPFSAVEPHSNILEPFPEEPEKETKRQKKDKKPSFWKSIVGFFSRKSAEDKDEEEDNKSAKASMSSEVVSDATANCLPTTPAASHKVTRRKSLRRRFSKRRLSLMKRDSRIIPADIGEFEAVVSVEPTYSYYEKVSEEMEKIVLEVKEKEKEEEQGLSDEDIINRIIALTKVEGDAIDNKLKDNPTLSNFFQGMTYSSFQKLADAYLEEEASPTHNPPTVLPTAPELVKLAFTLDFTARVAALSRQNIGHITSLGNHYLQERFKYEQAMSDHP